MNHQRILDGSSRHPRETRLICASEALPIEICKFFAIFWRVLIDEGLVQASVLSKFMEGEFVVQKTEVVVEDSWGGGLAVMCQKRIRDS